MPSLMTTTMKAIRRWAAAPGRERRRGSVLILVVAVIVLLAILGTSFLQVARVQRLGVDTYEGDIDAVTNSVLVQIEAKLREDLLDEDGVMFNQNSGPNDSGYDEPYDYAWTSTAGLYRSGDLLLSAGGYSALGGRYDDAWLASTTPAFDGTPRWPQITSLSGKYVGQDNVEGDDAEGDSRLNRVTPGLDAASVWDEFAVSSAAADDVNSSQGMSLTYTAAPGKLVDTDNDGMGDARWEFPPLPQIGGVIYVSAVRIVDLSAMINVDVATSPTDANLNFDAFTNAPRWDRPTELATGLFFEVEDAGNNAIFPVGDIDNERIALFNRRLNSPISGLGVLRSERADLWTEQASRYGSFASGGGAVASGWNEYVNADEWELRRSNGLSDGTTSGELETRMPTFLRANQDDATNRVLTSNPQAAEFYANPGDEGPQSNPRPYLTVSSGAANFTPRISGDPDIPVKLNVNDADAPAIAEAVAEVYFNNSGGTPGTLPSGFGNTNASGEVDRFAAQFAASLMDYKDSDNRPTGISLSGVGTFYGLERLPAITEVYVQRRYAVFVTNSGDLPGGDPQVAGTQDYEYDWRGVDDSNSEGGSAGWAIEIRNPWKSEISLENLELVVDGSILGGATLTDLAGVPATLDVDEVLVLHRPSNGGGDADNTVGGNSGDDIVEEEIDFTYTYVQVDPFAWPSAGNPGGIGGGQVRGLNTADLGSVRLEMRVLPEGESSPGLAYQRVDATTLPDRYGQRIYNEPATPDGSVGYIGVIKNSTTDGFNSLLVTESDWQNIAVASTILDEPEVGDTGREVSGDPLGRETKSPGVSPANPINTADEQAIVADRDLQHLGEVPLILTLAPMDPAVGPTDSTLAGVWQDLGFTSLDDYRIDLGFDAAAAPVNYDSSGAIDALRIPHSAMLLDRLAVFSPQTDGEDNDGDGDTDEDDERFVPGLVNLNTASELVLRTVLPIDDEPTRNEIAGRIIRYREAPDERPRSNASGDTEARTNVGIASISELASTLFGDRPTTANAATAADMAAPTGGTDPLRGADGNDTDEIGGTQVDFLANDDDGGGPANSGVDGVIDDVEERARVMGWLHQVASTRSDAFVAYILVKGYPADNPQLGAIESKRVMALFNRSGVEDNSSAVLQAVLVLD